MGSSARQTEIDAELSSLTEHIQHFRKEGYLVVADEKTGTMLVAERMPPVHPKENQIQALRYLKGLLIIAKYSSSDALRGRVQELTGKYPEIYDEDMPASRTHELAEEIAVSLREELGITLDAARKQVTMARDLGILLEDHPDICTISRSGEHVTREISRRRPISHAFYQGTGSLSDPDAVWFANAKKKAGVGCRMFIMPELKEGEQPTKSDKNGLYLYQHRDGRLFYRSSKDTFHFIDAKKLNIDAHAMLQPSAFEEANRVGLPQPFKKSSNPVFYNALLRHSSSLGHTLGDGTWLDNFFKEEQRTLMEKGVAAPPSARWLPLPGNVQQVEVTTGILGETKGNVVTDIVEGSALSVLTTTRFIRIGTPTAFDIGDIKTEEELAKKILKEVISQHIKTAVEQYRQNYGSLMVKPFKFFVNYESLLSPHVLEASKKLALYHGRILDHKDNNAMFVQMAKEAMQDPDVQAHLRAQVVEYNVDLVFCQTNSPINKMAISPSVKAYKRFYEPGVDNAAREEKLNAVADLLWKISKNAELDLINYITGAEGRCPQVTSLAYKLNQIRQAIPNDVSEQTKNEIILRINAAVHLRALMNKESPYKELKDYQRNIMRAAFEFLAQGDQGVNLVGCKSARDRTAIFAAAVKTIQENPSAMDNWDILNVGIVSSLEQGHHTRAMSYHVGMLKVSDVHSYFVNQLDPVTQQQMKSTKIFSKTLGKYTPEKSKQCDVFLMQSTERKKYKKSDSKNLYLYKIEDDQGNVVDVCYRIKNKYYTLKSKQNEGELPEVIKLHSDDFKQPAKKPIKCANTQIAKAALAITAKRGHTLPYASTPHIANMFATNAKEEAARAGVTNLKSDILKRSDRQVHFGAGKGENTTFIVNAQNKKITTHIKTTKTEKLILDEFLKAEKRGQTFVEASYKSAAIVIHAQNNRYSFFRSEQSKKSYENTLQALGFDAQASLDKIKDYIVRYGWGKLDDNKKLVLLENTKVPEQVKNMVQEMDALSNSPQEAELYACLNKVCKIADKAATADRMSRSGATQQFYENVPKYLVLKKEPKAVVTPMHKAA